MKYILFFLMVPAILFGAQKIDNLVIDGNTIKTIDTNGDLTLQPDGTGEVVVDSEMLVGDAGGESAHTIGGVSVQSALEVHTNGGSDLGGLSVHRLIDSATLGAHFLGYKSRGTSGSETIVQSGDVLSKYVSAGYDGTDYEQAAEIRTAVDATPGSNDMPGRISFLTTADGAVTPTEAVRIDSSQNMNLLTESELRLQDSSGGEYVGFKAPATVSSSQTYTLPDADGFNGQTMVTDGAGNLSWGEAGGSGSKNYFSSSNSKFESNSAGDWADGGSGSATLTESITSTSTEILQGTYSLELDKSAADGTNQYWAVNLDSIDRADQGTMLYGSIEFDASQDADYASGDLKIAVYDSTNSAYLYCGDDEDLEIPATKGRINFACSLASDTAAINFRLLINSTNAAQYSVFFDDFKFGPAAKVSSPVVTDWVDWTPTGSWVTNTTYTGRYRRVGSNAEFQVKLTLSGAPTAASLYINLPSGITIDTDRLYIGANSIAPLPNSSTTATDDSANTEFHVLASYNNSTSQVHFYMDRSDTTYGQYIVLNSTSPLFFNTNDTITANFTIPVEGWSDGAVVTENELSLQTVKVTAISSGGNAAGTGTDITFTEVSDSHNTWDGTTFTAPKTGIYEMRGFVNWNVAAATALYAYIDTVQDRIAGYSLGNSVSTLEFHWKGELQKGESWSLRPSGSITLVASTSLHWIEISSVQDYTVLGVADQQPGITSVSNSYSAVPGDETILADTSGGGFTITLTTAVGWSGKEFIIKYTDTGFANSLIVDGAGSETIGGSTTTTLNTEGETLHIVSDGSNWQIKERYIPKIINSYNVTASGGGTLSATESFFWYRDGRNIVIYGDLVVTTAGSGTSTVGLSLPGSLSADTSYVPSATTINPIGHATTYQINGVTGYDNMTIFINTSTDEINLISPGSSTTVKGAGFTINDELHIHSARIPIDGWNE